MANYKKVHKTFFLNLQIRKEISSNYDSLVGKKKKKKKFKCNYEYVKRDKIIKNLDQIKMNSKKYKKYIMCQIITTLYKN